MSVIDHPAGGASNLNAAVTGADRRTLDAVFRHPLSHNLSWREVVALVSAIGDVEEKPSGDYLFRAGDERLSIKKPHGKDLSTTDVMDLRRLLTRAGWSPDAAAPAEPESPSAAGDLSLIVVVDHAGAKVFRIDPSADDIGGVTALDPRHVVHPVGAHRRDQDREETYPADERFFEDVATALAPGGPIVLIGHGKGQSNEAGHLTAHLKRHHHDIYMRVVGELVADLPSLTTPELLQLGRYTLLAQSGVVTTPR
jgi:hypothetical protein